MHTDHTHPYLPAPLPLPTIFIPMSFCVRVYSLFSRSHLCEREFDTVCWSPAGSAVGTQKKKNDSTSLRICQQPIVGRKGYSQEPLLIRDGSHCLTR